MQRHYWCDTFAFFAALSGPAFAEPCTPVREAVSLSLANFASSAELVIPPQSIKRRGIVVLFAGSDVADMDGAIEGVDGTIISRPMLQVANRLACAGIASFRYNKRYVTGPTTVNRAKFDALNGADFAADGRTAVALVKTRSDLQNLPLGLVGWSEGTTVAMAVSATDRSVRAVVLMAPVVDTPAHVAQAQYQRIGKPYLARFAVNGGLDADAIARADAGPGRNPRNILTKM